MKRITDSTFIVAFHTVLHFFGYTVGIITKLQGTTQDVIQAYELVGNVKAIIAKATEDDEV